jgi:hypothetical protein
VGRKAVLPAIVVVAVVVAGALIIHARSSGGAAASDAARYRHYFAVGRRECHRFAHGLMPTPVGGIADWSGGVVHVSIKVPRSVPVRYRKAIMAGCEAASP